MVRRNEKADQHWPLSLFLSSHQQAVRFAVVISLASQSTRAFCHLLSLWFNPRSSWHTFSISASARLTLKSSSPILCYLATLTKQSNCEYCVLILWVGGRRCFYLLSSSSKYATMRQRVWEQLPGSFPPRLCTFAVVTAIVTLQHGCRWDRGGSLFPKSVFEFDAVSSSRNNLLLLCCLWYLEFTRREWEMGIAWRSGGCLDGNCPCLIFWALCVLFWNTFELFSF